MGTYALQERHNLADLLDQVGPDAPTLSGEWTTRDLAAHLVIRERRPDAGPGLVVPALSGWTERVRQGAMKDHDYPELIKLVRERPWWIGPVDEVINLMEYFVHHEDIRRAVPEFKPRDLDKGYEQALWNRLHSAAGAMMHGHPANLVAPGFGEKVVGSAPTVTITGAPGELILFAYGRQAVAQLDLDGPVDDMEKLRTATFGV
ncbi:MAG: TIGR03085 family protein [Longispora sp.]|nr:TIGR03085 family protein [Longispora sp. (in: high G+C Gram-positive bacteria)]